MFEKSVDLDAVDVELAALRNTLIEMRTAAVVESGRKSRTSVRRRIARLLAVKDSSAVG